MRLLKIKYRNLLGYLLGLIFFAGINTYAQNKELTETDKIFSQIENGFADNSVDKFSTFFSDKIFISLSSGTPKYYSANQAYYVIKNFLGIYNPTGFKFDRISSDSSNPFAWGELKYIKNGLKGKATIMVILANDKNQWKISQITIN